MWHRGAPSELWLEHVDDLLRTMYGQGTLSAEDLETALKEPIVFAHPGAEPVSDGAVEPTSVR